jgi:hypothetical protein
MTIIGYKPLIKNECVNEFKKYQSRSKLINHSLHHSISNYNITSKKAINPRWKTQIDITSL